MKKQRIDLLLVSKNLVSSRSKAQALIMAGQVFYDENYSNKVMKPGEFVSSEQELFVKEKLPYVGRGGQKLKGAIDDFQISLKGLTVLDVGASTGGFTDCALKEGAKKVYALDVGKSLLDYGLREDFRVEVIENCNFRYVDPSIFKEQIDFVTIDVSFISIQNILPNAFEMLSKGGRVLALVKPQFEAGKGMTVKGIVKDDNMRKEILKDTVFFAEKLGFETIDIGDSKLKGAKGNLESFIYLRKNG
jgi:23S rRNA (cytidine1920-2'-O)/16S rRNA (cytidine1409-2'-O)-methyltransferase